ncbi:WAT1-related protein [Glycine soja]
MAQKKASHVLVCKELKPHLLMVLVQVGYTFLYFITEASFNHGMSPHVYVTYRHIVAAVVMFPFAYFLERNARPKLTFALFMEIFVLSLLGVSVTLNMYFASLKYTNPTFVASMINTIASLTFIIAVALRFEVLDLRNPRGIAKVIGTIISLAGVLIMTLYKGPVMRNLWHPLIHIPGKSAAINEDWLKGSILTVSSCVTWSLWYIMQASTLKRYPAQLSLTTWMSFVGAAQSAAFTVIVEHNSSAWTIGLNVDLWSTIYGGVVVAGLIIYIQLWCTEKKGPVFVTVFNPLSTILVAILAYFVFGEKLYLGSIIGAIIVIIGLYFLLWGKEGDQEVYMKTKDKSQCSTSYVLAKHFRVKAITRFQATPAHGLSPKCKTKADIFSFHGNLCAFSVRAATLKRYPAPLSLTTWMCFLGAAQSAVLTVIVERNPSAWTIGFNIDLWSTIYAYFVLGEKLYFGSIIGAFAVIIGLYLLLWGKSEQKVSKCRNEDPECKSTTLAGKSFLFNCKGITTTNYNKNHVTNREILPSKNTSSLF